MSGWRHRLRPLAVATSRRTRREDARTAAAGFAIVCSTGLWMNPLFQASGPARVSGSSVTFEPGARAASLTHPLDQTLIITSGCGWVQLEGGPIEEIRPGDVVWFTPAEKHWHGATPTTSVSFGLDTIGAISGTPASK